MVAMQHSPACESLGKKWLKTNNTKLKNLLLLVMVGGREKFDKNKNNRLFVINFPPLLSEGNFAGDVSLYKVLAAWACSSTGAVILGEHSTPAYKTVSFPILKIYTLASVHIHIGVGGSTLFFPSLLKVYSKK